MAHFLNKANSFLVRRAPPQREQLRPPSLVGGRAREQRERRRRGRRRKRRRGRARVQQQRHGGRQPGMPDERKKERHPPSAKSTPCTPRISASIDPDILSDSQSGSGINFHNHAPNLIPDIKLSPDIRLFKQPDIRFRTDRENFSKSC